VIEPTDEMVNQARAAYRTSQAPDAEGQMRDVVAAVLAIVERDMRVCPRPAAHMEAERTGEWPPSTAGDPDCQDCYDIAHDELDEREACEVHL
jgi:hypothetical protein